LGYTAADVAVFSYRGGTTREQPYGPADTEVDLRLSARRLRDLLERLGRDQPGVPVDLIAHSQGGLVVRAALGDELDRGDPRLPPIANIVTLATPHQGATLATAAASLAGAPAGLAGESLVHTVAPDLPDARSPAVRELADTSTFVRRLARRPLPAGTRVTSIAARGDLFVPAPRT